MQMEELRRAAASAERNITELKELAAAERKQLEQDLQRGYLAEMQSLEGALRDTKAQESAHS